MKKLLCILTIALAVSPVIAGDIPYDRMPCTENCPPPCIENCPTAGESNGPALPEVDLTMGSLIRSVIMSIGLSAL